MYEAQNLKITSETEIEAVMLEKLCDHPYNRQQKHNVTSISKYDVCRVGNKGK